MLTQRRYLNPNGWVELQDIDFPLQCDDGSVPADSALGQWNELMMEAGERSGFLLDTCGRAEHMMRQAGFVDVRRKPFRWPLGPWAKGRYYKQLGNMALENFTHGLEGMCMALFTRFLGWSREQVLDFTATVREDMNNAAFHTYFNLYVTYGRKP